jgi:hypothetical protein
VSLLLPDCTLKVKDVLREFDADGRLAQHRHGEVRGNHGQVDIDPTTTHVCSQSLLINVCGTLLH